ncbi:MAG: glycosyltransferase family 2 protein [Clostridia bacterium]|nr:glycosyltransferase family 2 protein [Clostridia bacterium]
MQINNHQPVVSVIIPTYNRKALLQRSIDSALSQTLENIEVIVIDDGSTDGTEELFSSVHDSRVQYHRLSHQGGCAARNAGINLSTGKYIAFLDSDDLWLPHKLSLQCEQLESAGADAVCCAFSRHDGQSVTRFPDADHPAGQIHYQQLLGGNIVSTQTILGRTECMKKVLFDEAFPRMQDWEYAIRLAKDNKLVYFPDALAELYVQNDSISRKPHLGLQAIRMLLQKYRQDYILSLPNTLLMLNTMNSFAEQCGKHCFLDCLKTTSFKRSPKDNIVLLRRAASMLLHSIKSALCKKG